MKKLLLTAAFLIMCIGLFGQPTLTHKNNALNIGDTNISKEIQYLEAGNAGANQIWDYTNIQVKGENPVSKIQIGSVQELEGLRFYNTSLIENGYDYFMNSTQTKLEELGYSNNELKMTLVYSDPVLKMKYPFAYGEQFTDHFIGIAYFNETSKIDFFGDCIVAADAFGTLVLPDRVVENALRVKSIKKGLQINMCGTTDVNIVRYSWYASGYRYPVLTTNMVETRYNEGAPVFTKTAYINTQQRNQRSALIGSDITGMSINEDITSEIAEITVVLSPNPFHDKLSYSYSLNKQLPVSIELYDVSGKHSGWLIKDKVQSEGLQSGDFETMTNSLTPGVYFVRFTFDKQVIMRKIIKI